jgi:hypothetical protein
VGGATSGSAMAGGTFGVEGGIFIGGSGRCGTSVLGDAFALHPEAVYLWEPRFIADPGGLMCYVQYRVGPQEFREYMERRVYRNLPRRVFPRGLRKTLHTGKKKRRVDFVSKFIHSAIGELPEQGDRLGAASKFVDEVFGEILARTGRKFWVEKTPNTVACADILWQMFPGMHYIHILRDPRDVYASLVARGAHSVEDVYAYIYRRYLPLMVPAFEAQKRVPRSNYHVISLEAMAGDPLGSLARLAEQISIPGPDKWVRKAASAFNAKKAHIGRWEQEVSINDAREIAKRCGPIYFEWKARESGEETDEGYIEEWARAYRWPSYLIPTDDHDRKTCIQEWITRHIKS